MYSITVLMHINLYTELFIVGVNCTPYAGSIYVRIEKEIHLRVNVVAFCCVAIYILLQIDIRVSDRHYGRAGVATSPSIAFVAQ